ncbi:MAG: hypothetical protein VKL39_22035 [Leptolyngbyaceae bacterium]|nr:hypothetical protein [Leptolyngbyaceae bacterium]
MPIGIYTPKPKAVLTKVFPIARTDNGTEVGALPKDAIVIDAIVTLSGACAGTTATISLGYTGTAGAFVNAFNVSTADAGVHGVTTKAGADVIAGTKLTADKKVISTYAAGDSGETTGALGFIRIDYVVPGSGESLTS